MMPVARVTDMHVCPLCKVPTPIVEGSPMHKADGLPVARVGDKTGCGAVILKGSSLHKADGRPIAYLGSNTSHGGVITTGSPMHKVMP